MLVTRLQLLNLSFLAALTLCLSACNKQHGYEGEYRLEHSSGIDSMDEMISLFSDFIGQSESPIIVIGSNFLDVNGSRTTYDKIFVRESGRHRYLIFLQGQDEQIWKIEDGGKRLEQNAGFIQLKLHRVDVFEG